MGTNYKIIASSKNWIEDGAKIQLENAAKLPGVIGAFGMPDLHPGKGGPIGASLITKNVLYPFFIGSDIGCGMRFSMLNRSANKINEKKWVRLLLSPDEISTTFDSVDEYFTVRTEMEKYFSVGEFHNFYSDEGPDDFDSSLGSIGAGNHFAEIQSVEKLHNEKLFFHYGLQKNSLYLLVHSGSRSVGARVLRHYVDARKNEGCRAGEKEFERYVLGHNAALKWASLNRRLIAQKFLGRLQIQETMLWDNFHNYAELAYDDAGGFTCIHRKGAVKAGEPVLIPGTRGSLSYLVSPLRCDFDHGYSLAHGAGRKWNRVKSRSMSKIKYKDRDIRRIKGHSLQVSHDKDALYEEAPEAYKNIDTVISDLAGEGLIEVIASFRPALTFKAEL